MINKGGVRGMRAFLKVWWLPFLLLYFALFSAILIFGPIAAKQAGGDIHLMLLARQFLKGSVELSPLGLPNGDIVAFFDRRFIYFGPWPSILLMPLAFLTKNNQLQEVLGWGALLFSFCTAYFLALKLKFSDSDSFWLALFLVFSTVLFGAGLVNISAYLVQAVGFTFVLFALGEYFGSRRWWLIGILVALAGLTRMTLYFSLVYFLAEIFRTKFNYRAVLLLFLPVVISLLILGAYNYKRFRTPWETGYRYNLTLKNYPMNVNAGYGFMSLSHLPANLYSLLLKAPDPVLAPGGGFVLKFPYLKADGWGMALWFTSPLFLLLFRAKKEAYSRSAWLSVLVLAVPSLLYYGVGFTQFGYRYALDFLPFLFLALLPNLRPRLSLFAKSLIVLGILFNALYLSSLWGIYPHFNLY